MCSRDVFPFVFFPLIISQFLGLFWDHLGPPNSRATDQASVFQLIKQSLHFTTVMNQCRLLCCSLLFLILPLDLWFCVSCIRRLMFPSKISPSLNIPDLHPKVTYCFSEGSAVSLSSLMDDVFVKWTQLTVSLFRSSMVCRCLAWRTLLQSRKDFYVCWMGKRQPRRSMSSLTKTRGLQGQVGIYTTVSVLSCVAYLAVLEI